VQRATLVLEDGTVFAGQALGAVDETWGEIVFNTSMTGYQEVLTDPSYRRQIVVMTAPHIGNTGINAEDSESEQPWLAGFVVREASRRVSNWRATSDLESFLREHGIVAMTGVSTRALVRHIRSEGAMRAVLSSVDSDVDSLSARARSAPSMHGLDLAQEVTCQAPYVWSEGTSRVWYRNSHRTMSTNGCKHVVVFDFGVKRSILRMLVDLGLRLTVVPASFSAEQTLALAPDGILLSNGPGDPAAVTYAVETIRKLLGQVPIFGICLGHQLLALALGGSTYKLKFGHRGSNQPVKDLATGRVEITTHNHGFAVDADSLPHRVRITHLNLNDRCVEGLSHDKLRAFSVQYHPEAAPGPHDATYLFNRFDTLMEQSKASLVHYAQTQ
jgi:carbamoyl-phosphate synthase small subunit